MILGDKLTNQDTDEDGKSVFLSGSGGEVKSGAYVKYIYSNSQAVNNTVHTTIVCIDPEPLVAVVLGIGDDGIPFS